MSIFNEPVFSTRSSKKNQGSLEMSIALIVSHGFF
ncbi:hypothetical protein GGR06_000167 [Bacteroides reticulotermitis]|uniref:Uncharacterized protein n=1 Tax=Bacteroides reticulotermitis TaxID=1133319 RepID=A0A840CWF9_9BACE|nr:hypothetical protein [Bacteroides reticulotermitis]